MHDNNVEMPREVKYVANEYSDSKLVPETTFVGSSAKKGRPCCTSRFAVLLSALTLVVSLVLLALCLTWLRGVPEEVQLQKKTIEELQVVVEEQQGDIDGLKNQPLKWAPSVKYEKEEYDVDASGDPCARPKDSGPCMAAMPRWYFNQGKGQCEQFTYGGCRGNGNNFITLHDCQEQCEKPGDVVTSGDLKARPIIDGQLDVEAMCGLAPSAGPCHEQMPRFYYDKQDGECKKFLYSGCAGNANNFVTEDECQSTCGVVDINFLDVKETVIKRLEDDDRPDYCYEQAKTGMCRAIIQRWAFNKDTERCEEFTFGGCGANENNFATKAKCESGCKVVRIDDEAEEQQDNDVQEKEIEDFGDFLSRSHGDNEKEDVCILPARIGMCRASMPRYFYNSDSGECELFVYGGCDGNGNNFQSEDECRDACKKVEP